MIHGHPGGPPNGVGKLLIIVNRSPNLTPAGPETPSQIAGSAQRQVARKPAGTSNPTGSRYRAVKYDSPRPTSSIITIVLLSPSTISEMRLPPSCSAAGSSGDPAGSRTGRPGTPFWS